MKDLEVSTQFEELLFQVIKELKELAGDQEDEEEDEAAMLSEEAMLPIEELLKRMKQVMKELFRKKDCL